MKETNTTRGILYQGGEIFTNYVTSNGVWRLSKWHDGCMPEPKFSLEYRKLNN